MRIEHRDPALTYTRAIREDKRQLVLDWLLEFQFSSVELLARRLGTVLSVLAGHLAANANIKADDFRTDVPQFREALSKLSL